VTGGFVRDTSFDHDLGSFPDQDETAITGLALLGARLYLGGYFTSVDGQTRQGLARLDAAGSLDSWAPALLDELGAPDDASLDLQPRDFVESNGAVLVSGVFDWYPRGGGTVTPMSSLLVYDADAGDRVRPSESNDPWFPSHPSSYGAYDITMSDGSIYVAMGYSGIEAFDPTTFDYLPDSSFTTEFNGVNVVYALATQPAPPTLRTASAASVSAVVAAGDLPRWGNHPTGNIVALTPNLADLSPPIVSVPKAKLLAAQPAATTINLRVSWPAATDASGIGQYQLQYKKGSGSWTAVALGSPTALAVDVPVAPGKVYQFRLRATDTASNTSAWQMSPVSKLSLTQENSAVLSYTGTWKRAALTASSAGYVKWSKSAAATMTYHLTGTSVGFITDTGPARGKVDVWLDGSKVATLDLYAASVTKKVIFWVNTMQLAGGGHALVLKPLGTKNPLASSARVDIDGILVWN
jgi:hypothetical protein